MKKLLIGKNPGKQNNEKHNIPLANFPAFFGVIVLKLLFLFHGSTFYLFHAFLLTYLQS